MPGKSVGMETDYCLESSLSCVLSLRALIQPALDQIHYWVYQSHICLRNVTTAQIKLLMHFTTHRHDRAATLEWGSPGERRTGAGLWMWHRQSWLWIPSSTTWFLTDFSAKSHQHRISDYTTHLDEQTAAGDEQDWDIGIWLKFLCFHPERPSFRGVNAHPRSTMHKLRWLLQ